MNGGVLARRGWPASATPIFPSTSPRPILSTPSARPSTECATESATRELLRQASANRRIALVHVFPVGCALRPLVHALLGLLPVLEHVVLRLISLRSLILLL